MNRFNLSLTPTRLIQRLALSCVVAGALSTFARATIVGDLGSAADFSVLTYNSNNSSSDAFNGAPIGVVNGNWVQSGGDSSQQNNTVYLSPGFTNNGNPGNGIVESTVVNGPLLTSAWNSAVSTSASYAALAPTQTFGNLTSATTITGVAGTNVINIGGINQAQVILTGPANASFIINVSGSITLNGGAGSGGLLTAGGVSNSNVVYNILNGNSVTVTGGGNTNVIDGIVLDTSGSVNLHPGAVNGEVIAQTFTSSSNAAVTGSAPPVMPVPETNSALILGPLLGLILLFSSKRLNLRSLLFRRREALA